jgi:hypothetical protein
MGASRLPALEIAKAQVMQFAAHGRVRYAPKGDMPAARDSGYACAMPRPNWSRPLSIIDNGKEFLRPSTLADVPGC